MKKQNTLYIAEPLFSKNLQNFDADASFPLVKKIGITTDHPERREKELLGTKSPVKVSIVKAWNVTDARKVESLLHTLLGNSQVDGEYFWDGNETLIEAVSSFINQYHPDATEIDVNNSPDTKEAQTSVKNKKTTRLYSEVLPKLEKLGVEYNIVGKDTAARVILDGYRIGIMYKSNNRYTATIRSPNRTTEQALEDFTNAEAPASHSTGTTNRIARISLSPIETIISSIKNYTNPNK